MKRMLLPMVLGCLLALPATAQQDGPFGGFKHDRTEPIDIEADSLEVRQAENIAIFAGSVVAGQGTLRLTAERVEVTFDPDNQETDNSGAIKKMVARGNVFISNGSETAKGDRAEYDVDGGKINMTGKVVLTQGGNVISGQTLTINLNSGQGRIEGTGTGRVKSIFTPATSD